MCAISGVIANPRYDAGDVAKMIDCIAYRGPDEQDVATIGPAVLGHARLAVVDKKNGGQPMSNTDGTVWVVFNGEIYNFVEMREDLKAKGYVFKSRCDTEVLVHLWREKGPAMLDDLIGMYAFCLWDTKENRGILARDRQGIKPCYIADLAGGGFAFASEIKSIRSLPGFHTEIDDVSINLMHSFNYCPPPRTCFKGITCLKPGSYLEIAADGTRSEKQYWNWPISRNKQDLEMDEFSWLIDDSVRMQMRFDVEGCLFLSGGVDSSIVAAHLLKQWNRDEVLAFGLDCREEGYGEFHLAQSVAKHLSGIDLRPVTYDCAIVPDNIDTVLHHMDQPHGDFSFFLILELCKAAKASDVIVAFNGDGPDEVLSGFTHNQAYFGSGQAFSPSDYFQKICFMPEASRNKLLTKEFSDLAQNPENVFADILEKWPDLEPMDQIAAYECTSLAPGNNLVKTDRMGAGMSIEGRSPFLDHRVVEALTQLPQSQKFNDGISKYYLKDYGQRFFEREHMFRQKSMPTMPIGEWIKGPLQDWAQDTLRTLDASRYNVSGALQMFEEHKNEQANYTRELRTLLMTAVWSRNLCN